MVNRLFKKMSHTQIISGLIPTLCMLIDSILIGRILGVDAMSAYGISAPLIIMYGAMGFLMVNGIGVVLGRAMGRGDREETNVCFTSSIVLALIVSAISILVIFAAGNPICTALGAGGVTGDNTVFFLTRDYLQGYLLGAPFFFISQILETYLQTIGKRKVLLVSVITMIIADVVFDLMSIYVFDAGMFGIGLATSLSYLAAFIVCIISFLDKDCIFRFGKGYIRISCIASILREGSPILFNQVFFTIRTFLFNWILIGLSGTEAVAIFAVFTTLGNLIYSIGYGSGTVALMLSSIFYGDEDRSSLKSLVSVMISHSFLILLVTIIIAEITAPWIIQLFMASDPELYREAVIGLRIFLIGLIADNLNDVFKNYFQGIGEIFITNLIAFFKCLAFMIPSVLLFSRVLQLTGFWIGTVVGQTITFLSISVIIWRKFGRVAVSEDAYCYLGPDFGARPEDYVEMAVKDVDDAVHASERLSEFCREKGISGKTGMLIGLCVEEMTINIIEHGFNKDRQSHNIDVRMTVKDDRHVIRIRDNCVDFDPTKYMELHQDNENDPSAHIGLRMVMGLVKEASYVNTLGLNNLTLVL